MAVAAGAIGVGVGPAQATPGQFSPAFPTVYISQVSGSTTDLKQAVQSRLANAGAGGVTISTVGTSVASYNAMGYRTADQYLYGMVGNHLNRVSSNGSSTDTGAVAGLPAGSYYSGAFGAGAYADTLFVMPLSGSTIYGIDAATSAVTTTLNLSASIGVADFTWANGYLWGISTSTGAPKLTRISMTGAVTTISTTGIFPVGDTGYYGAAWVYGNGNLAFSYNSTGRITQLKVTDPSGIAPTAALVSHIAGPSTSANDGATTPATDSDLGLALTQPAAADPGDLVTWQVTVSDAGPGGSSGGTLTFTVPAGVTVTSADLPTGCTLTGAVVQCISGQIAAAANDTYDFSGILNAGLTVPQTSTVAIVGNENDPDATDDTADLTFAPAPQNHTSNGTGIATQTTTVAKPSDASVYLLDGSTQVSTVAVPNQGTYTVDPETGVITFAPVTGFTGTASPVDFVIVPVTGATAAGSYQAAVAPPAGPTAVPVSTTGVGIDQQATAALAPAGGQLTLVDADGNDVMYLFTDDGGYSVEGDHLVFDEHRGWSGTAPAAAYKITDAYGQTSTSAYTVTVTT